MSLSFINYETPVYTSGLYTPDTPFKGLICTVAGNVVIRGLNKKNVTLPLLVGNYPYGGETIVESGTTATVIAGF